MTEFTPTDFEARTRALDVTGSFCVTAPAGSGKTELLTQRVLSLLATVEQPEEILAITFTRKAAGEMRNRISMALTAAHNGQAPTSAHEMARYQLAEKALQRDRERGWNLISNPGRLSIQTIDGLCMQLARQLPVLSQFGGSMAPMDDPLPSYEAAAAATLQLVNSSSELAADIEVVLRAFHNDWQGLRSMLTGMLWRREQWLELMSPTTEQEQAADLLQRAVVQLIVDHCSLLAAQLVPFAPEMCEIGHFAAGILEEVNPDSELRRLADLEALSLADLDLQTWRALANFWLVSNKPAGRKKWTINEGMPPAGHDRGEQSAAYKVRCAQLIAGMQTVPGLLEMLHELRLLPNPNEGSEDWELIGAVMNTLKLLAAQLQLEFQARGQVDFPQVAMAARQALGDEQAPTDVSMLLDYRLRHILIDEFQDTSSAQFSLVEQLTRGWMEHNHEYPEQPRTLFIVGDGMQSIYGFREANVALFKRSLQQGINGIELEPVHLSTNFRSRRKLVDWINATFGALPAAGLRDVAPFNPGVPRPDNDPENRVHLLSFEGEAARDMEARAVCGIIRQAEQSTECKTLAILVRNRSHLVELLPCLAEQGIRWQAVDIDPLAERAAIIDVMNIYKALYDQADEIAWLALLRAPWCGLEGSDLLALRPLRGEQRPSLWSAIREAPDNPGLSADAKYRLARLHAVMERALAKLEGVRLRLVLEETWLDLGGPGCVEGSAYLDDVEAFFHRLEALEIEQNSLNPMILQRAVDKLYARERVQLTGAELNCAVQIMTLHKSKGLEFDWVVIPALDRTGGRDNRAILEWRDYTSVSGATDLLLAVRAGDKAEEDSSLYSWLRHDRSARARLEQQRLLYVGMSRAANRLFCTACVTRDNKGNLRRPAADQLLACVWETFVSEAEESVADEVIDIHGDESELAYGGNRIRRLELNSFTAPIISAGRVNRFCLQGLAPDFDFEARAVGTAIHAVLEALVLETVLPESLAVRGGWQGRVVSSLVASGLSEMRAVEACAEVFEHINKALSDSTGRWILDNSHTESHVEFPVEMWTGSEVQLFIVDRVIVVDGERWIIDYKSSRPREGEDIDSFCDHELAKYRSQLERYADALNRLKPMPTRMALYFTALGKLAELPIPD